MRAIVNVQLSSVRLCVYVFVNAITLEPFHVSSKDYHSILLPLSKLR